jgi:hypothetical protein
VKATQLSRNALHCIVLSAQKKGCSVKDKYFEVQVVENKKKEGDGKSANIKQRLLLSDGTSIIIAMVTKSYNQVEFPKYSVVRIRGNMNVQSVNKRT